MRRTTLLVAVIVAAAIGAYFGSPYWTVYEMRSAAMAGEGDRLGQYVDWPAVRESIKSQFTLVMNNKMASDPSLKDNPFAGFGQMMAAAMIGPMVDRFVTPDALAGMIAKGKASREQRAFSTTASDVQDSPPPRITREFEGFDVFKVSIHNPDDDSKAIVFVLNRSGLFSWKLTAVRMPVLM